MLERFKELLKEKGILDRLSGDKVVDAIILTDAISCDEQLKEITLIIGLNEIVNYLTVTCKCEDVSVSIRKLIEKYEDKRRIEKC